MDFLAILSKHYESDSLALKILLRHGEQISSHALKVGEKLHLKSEQLQFLEEISYVHDIGIKFTDAKEIGCFGEYPYICHGYLGSELLQKENYPAHALACERHTGVGITLQEIIERNLPVPHREMCPVSMEEKILAYVDKFYSKDPKRIDRIAPVDKIVKRLKKFDPDKAKTFLAWHELFNV